MESNAPRFPPAADFITQAALAELASPSSALLAEYIHTIACDKPAEAIAHAPQPLNDQLSLEFIY